MGDYLKEAYLLAELNKNIDKDYQKLSDKLHDLTLSHNRKKKALEFCLKFFEVVERTASCSIRSGDDYVACFPVMCSLVFAVKKIVCDALYSDGRVYYKPHKITMRDVKRRTKKGGRQCAQD